MYEVKLDSLETDFMTFSMYPVELCVFYFYFKFNRKHTYRNTHSKCNHKKLTCKNSPSKIQLKKLNSNNSPAYEEAFPGNPAKAISTRSSRAPPSQSDYAPLITWQSLRWLAQLTVKGHLQGSFKWQKNIIWSETVSLITVLCF